MTSNFQNEKTLNLLTQIRERVMLRWIGAAFYQRPPTALQNTSGLRGYTGHQYPATALGGTGSMAYRPRISGPNESAGCSSDFSGHPAITSRTGKARQALAIGPARTVFLRKKT